MEFSIATYNTPDSPLCEIFCCGIFCYSYSIAVVKNLVIVHVFSGTSCGHPWLTCMWISVVFSGFPYGKLIHYYNVCRVSMHVIPARKLE